MTSKITSFTIIALILTGCNAGKKKNMESNETPMETAAANTSEGDDIQNIRWELTTLEGTDVDGAQESGRTIFLTLNPDGHRVSGYSGCNTFMGTYTLESGNRITFSKLASTRMACPDTAFNESALLNIFETADNYTISGDELFLNKAKRAPLAAFKKAVIQGNPITEKYWKLKTLEGKDVQMAKNQEKEIYFILKTDESRVKGFAGCNTIDGTYTLENGNRIRFSNMLSTLKACPDVNVNESEFLKVFELADNYTIVDDVLSLNVGRRAPLAIFEAVYFN